MDAAQGLDRLVGIVASRSMAQGGRGGGGGDGRSSSNSAHSLGSRARAHADAVAALERCCRGEGRGSGGGGGGSGGGAGAALVSSVAPFNVIHLACHHEAARADRSMRVPKTEWEGATLRNSRVACNSLLPLRSPTTSCERYQTGLDRHMANLAEVRVGGCTAVWWVSSRRRSMRPVPPPQRSASSRFLFFVFFPSWPPSWWRTKIVK